MSETKDPNSEEKAVLRLIHSIYYKAGLPLPVQMEAFRPTDKDIDGISVFDATKVTPQQILLAVPPEKQNLYYVASMSVTELKNLGLSVKPSEIDAVPGHCVIPEMNGD